MVWGLDSVVGGIKGMFSSSSTPPSNDTSLSPQSTSTSGSLASSSQPTLVTSRTTSSPNLTTITATTPQQQQPTTPESSEQNSNNSYWFSSRSRKQFTVFAAGATFLLVSTRITVRSLRRKHMQMFPSFYHPSNAPPVFPVNGPIEAVEALAVASVNVFSTSLMVSGGLLWAFDISSIEDLRRKVRGGLGVDGSGRSEKQVEEEFEEWLASTLERKKQKEERDGGGGIGAREDVIREWKNERGQVR